MKKIIIFMLSLLMIIMPASGYNIAENKQTASKAASVAYDSQSDLKSMKSEYINELKEEKQKQKEIQKLEDEKKQELAKKQQNQNTQQQTTASNAEYAQNLQNAADGGYIDAFNISSRSKYLIYVNLTQQMVYVLTGSKGNWKLVNSFQCSSGVGSYPDGGGTPTGEFTVASRGAWFFADKYKEGAEYWTQFYGNYLFHSYPMDKNHNVLDTTLGQPSSHGCVRLAIENAKWIYNNVPKGTKVYIK